MGKDKTAKKPVHRTASKNRTKHAAEPSLLEALANPVDIKPYHHKPYRVRHLGSLLIAVIALVGAIFFAGQYVQRLNTPAIEVNSTDSAVQPLRLVTVKSAYGFAVTTATDLFDVTATATSDDGQESYDVTPSNLRTGQNIGYLALKPRVESVPAPLLSSRMLLRVNPDPKAFSEIKNNPANASLTDGQIASQLLPLESVPSIDATILSSLPATLNGSNVQKTTYQLNSQTNGSHTFTIVWTGVVEGRAFALTIDGLIGSSGTPEIYQSVLDSLSLSQAQTVLGLSTFAFGSSKVLEPLADKYRSDLVSPSVVKIYRLFCSKLAIEGNAIEDTYCSGRTGSGFMLSSDGYIATNGHVTSLNATDELVSAMISSPKFLEYVLKGSGFSPAQITVFQSNPAYLSAFIAKIYELPEDTITFLGQKDATFVSLGTEPLKLESSKDVDALIDTSDTDTIKKAKIIGENYSFKESVLRDEQGKLNFTTSDVSLIKVDVSNAPALGTTTNVSQNQKITVLGFPGDAENSLVSSDSLSVSVTNGNISSIRDASGKTGKLYQSDADASHGNSGGPAVDENGNVLGLLTYRIAGDSSGNAAKSYIRDIQDLLDLVDDKNVKIDTASTTQSSWAQGLRYVSENKYSKAVKEFEKVRSQYPAHRLASSYIDSSKKAIAEGRDVGGTPIVLLVVIGLIALVGGGVTIFMIARHHGKHTLHKNGLATTGTVPGQLSPTLPAQSVPSPQQQAGPVDTPTTAQAPVAPIQQPTIVPPQAQPGAQVQPTQSSTQNDPPNRLIQ